MNKQYATYISCFLMLAFGMVLAVMSPLLGEISEEFSLSLSQSGLIFTVNFIGFIIFVFIAGFLADKFGKKPILAVSSICFAVSLFLFSYTANFYYALVAIFFVGGLGGAIESMTSALVSELNPENPSYYINMAQIFLCVGALIGPVMAGYVVSSGMGWRICYLILSAAALVCAVIFTAARFPSTRLSGAEAGRDKEAEAGTETAKDVDSFGLKELISNRIFLIACLGMMLYTGSEVGAWGWMSTYLESNMGFTINKSSAAVGVFWVSMLVGRLLCGKLTEKFELRKIIIVLALFSSVVTMLSGILSNEFSMWIIIGLMGFSYSSIYPFTLSFGSKSSSRQSAKAFSLLVASGSLGTIIVPYIMGVIGEFANIRAAMITPGVLLLALALMFMGQYSGVKARSHE